MMISAAVTICFKFHRSFPDNCHPRIFLFVMKTFKVVQFLRDANTAAIVFKSFALGRSVMTERVSHLVWVLHNTFQHPHEIIFKLILHSPHNAWSQHNTGSIVQFYPWDRNRSTWWVCYEMSHQMNKRPLLWRLCCTAVVKHIRLLYRATGSCSAWQSSVTCWIDSTRFHLGFWSCPHFLVWIDQHDADSFVPAS
jgi:hypothetical protein